MSLPPNPPIIGEFSNWVGMTSTETETMVDFAFIEPAPEGQPKSAVIIRRMILPNKVAEELGMILSKAFKKKLNESKSKK